MARKSNKTAHVLNLLAGHDSKTDDTETVAAEPETKAAAEASKPSEASSSPVEVIDATADDPVAELIHNKLLDDLNKEAGEPASVTETVPEAAVEETVPEPNQETIVDEPVPETKTETVVDEPVPEPETKPTEEPVPEPEPKITVEEPVPEPETKPAENPVPEPEPDYVTVNVMERIVTDKIIYFMRQFDVCTCDRCVADAIALTLNGLAPKYIVTMPMAVDPLLSLYTNRFISDVTVEATKACIIIKDNPRH